MLLLQQAALDACLAKSCCAGALLTLGWESPHGLYISCAALLPLPYSPAALSKVGTTMESIAPVALRARVRKALSRRQSAFAQVVRALNLHTDVQGYRRPSLCLPVLLANCKLAP